MHAITITEGADAEQAVASLFAGPAADVIHSRNAETGCYMFAIQRAESHSTV